MPPDRCGARFSLCAAGVVPSRARSRSAAAPTGSQADEHGALRPAAAKGPRPPGGLGTGASRLCTTCCGNERISKQADKGPRESPEGKSQAARLRVAELLFGRAELPSMQEWLRPAGGLPRTGEFAGRSQCPGCAAALAKPGTDDALSLSGDGRGQSRRRALTGSSLRS